MSVGKAQTRFDEATRQHGAGAFELVDPLLDLATAEARAGDFSEAADHFAGAVRLVETLRGAMHDRLLEPLRGLGLSANAAGDFSQAAEALERALHIMRIHHGLHYLGQTELLHALARSYVGLGQSADAEFKKRTALTLAEREYGAESLRLLPAVSALAEWYHEQHRYFEERTLLERKIDLLETEYGKNDPRLIEPLRTLALSYRLEYNPLPEGLKALKRALDIHELHAGDKAAHAATLVDLGDWYLVFRERMRAMQTYARAYDLLSGDAAMADRLEALFGSPVPLFYVRPRPPEIDPDAPEEELGRGFVLVEYDVSSIGRAVDIELLDSDPPGVMDHRFKLSLRGARFRPRIVDGKPVHTKGLRMRSTFAFRRPEAAASPQDP